jgi:prephenate dehydratase
MSRSGFLGEFGSHSEAACELLWPGSELVPCRDAADVVKRIERGLVDTGALPIENTLAGHVTATDDAILSAPALHIVSEAVVAIHHCIMAPAGATLAGLRSVSGHPIALAQCNDFFERNPHLEQKIALDSGTAAREVASAKDRTQGALASQRAAQRYSLDVLASDVEDRTDNQTRFFGIAAETWQQVEGAPAKSTIAITTDNVSGALLHVLEPIAAEELSLTRLVARPTGDPWKYRFVLDLAHAAGDAKLDRAVAAVRRVSTTLRLLGTYPSEMRG